MSRPFLTRWRACHYCGSVLLWFRTRARSLAAAVLVSFVALGGMSSGSHSSECHDVECAQFLAHDASAHRIQSGSPDSGHPLHCVLCHWTRSTRHSAEIVHHLARPTEDGVRHHIDVISAPALIRAAQPPLRSPPSTPAPHV